MGVKMQLFEAGAHRCTLSAKQASTILAGVFFGLKDAHGLPA
jgi:hypothetical protein